MNRKQAIRLLIQNTVSCHKEDCIDPECKAVQLLTKPFPKVVCLCGSTRFWREFQKQSLHETMAGKIVLSIGAASGTDEEHFGNLPQEEYNRIKAMLDELHLRKIDMSDEVLILNVGGYIGESTYRELEYATSQGIPVRFLEPHVTAQQGVKP